MMYNWIENKVKEMIYEHKDVYSVARCGVFY